MTWQQQYPGQGAPPPAGFVYPNSGYPQGPYPQGPYPPQPGYGYPGQPAYGGQAAPGYIPQPDFPMGHSEYESTDFVGSGFSDKNIRRGFIRKVYGILMCQLLVTLAMISFFLYHEPTKRFVQENRMVFPFAVVAMLILFCVLVCCVGVRRRAPYNFILLGLFTLVEGFMLGCITAFYQVDEVWLAVIMTAAVCLSLTLFAFQTKWDFTMCGGVVMSTSVILLMFGVFAFFVQVKIVSLLYSCFGVILFSFYLIYDTQLMMGGKHKYSISPEEYVFAALSLYLDVINIFIFILNITQSSRN